MASRLIDPQRFAVEAVVVDWLTLARRRPDLLRVVEQLRKKNQPVRWLQLRWMLHKDMGMPTEPFTVWRKRSTAQGLQKNIPFEQLSFPGGVTSLSFQETLAVVQVDVQSSVSNGLVMGVGGAPTPDHVTAFASVSNGAQSVTLTGQSFTGLMLDPGVSVVAVHGIPTRVLGEGDWEKVEVVGLPVDPQQWTDLGYTQPQGLVSALGDPRTAAVQRLQRGAPLVGWEPELSPGVPAPLWQAPDFPQLVAEMGKDLLPRLHAVMGAAPRDQFAKQFKTNVPRPSNASGDKMQGKDGVASLSPLLLTLLGASSDPFLSLVLGFGTAYPAADASQATIAAPPSFDFMVTARWAKGLNGASGPVEYAALAPRPRPALPPLLPSQVKVQGKGTARPTQPDLPWKALMELSWERQPTMGLLRVASFAAACAGISPAAPARALLSQRASGGFMPIAAAIGRVEEESWRVKATDSDLTLPPTANTVQTRYAAATQDIFGLWSPWAAVDASVKQPPVEPVRIVSAELRATPAVAPKPCPATLVVDFVLDWRVRRPSLVRLEGRLYAAPNRGTPPASNLNPGVLDRTVGGGQPALEIPFTNDTPDAAFDVKELSLDGEKVIPFGSSSEESRRYRLSVPGFNLDFGATGHIGCALWARQQERVPPQRVGAWPDKPYLTASSDPRPPVFDINVENVQPASLPDATGQCHARISWPSKIAGATGYFLYESTETKILAARNMSEAPPGTTLVERLKRLKQAYNDNPTARALFTRRNATALQGTDTDVTLPRGSTSIHVYVVLAVNAGQVESAWPASDKALIPVAAPLVMPPLAPRLEVRQVLDTTVDPPTYKADVRVSVEPSPPAKRVDLHRVRVDDAARELDMMGPPIASVSTSDPTWSFATETDRAGVPHLIVKGLDTPTGSWKRVWYRAVAWSADDPARGYLGGRSEPSGAFWVIVPPPTPPDLSLVTMEWPGGPLSDVLLRFTSRAPVPKTPLGPHRLDVYALQAGAPSGSPLFTLESTLEALGTTPPASGSGTWNALTLSDKSVEYRVLLRRAAQKDGLSVTVRLTDPLGRMTERLVTVPSGPVDPKPDLLDVQVTKVAGTGVVLSFGTSAPLTPTLVGPYMVRVTALVPPPPKQRPTIPAPTLPGSPIVRPSPGPTIPPIFTTPTATKPKQLVAESALSDMPVNKGGGMPPGSEPLVLFRQAGGSPRFSALCREAASRFIVRITAPDGRFEEVTREVH